MPSANIPRDRTDGSPRSAPDRSGSSRLARPLSLLAFWGAIVLPAVYVPLFIVGLGTTAELLAFLGLFSLHVLALVAGRGVRRPPRSDAIDS